MSKSHQKSLETVRNNKNRFFLPWLLRMLDLTSRYLCPRSLQILVFLPDSYDTIKSSLYVNAMTCVTSHYILMKRVKKDTQIRKSTCVFKSKSICAEKSHI